VRNADKARDVLGEGAKTIVAELTDRPTLERAFKGVTSVFVVTGHNPNMVEQQKNVLEAALGAGVQNLVRVSGSRFFLVPRQQGLPITFGFKAAGWSAEINRHRQRLAEIAQRMDVGQLCGGVGSLSSLGPRAFEIQARFLSRLGLRPPEISWTSSRDVLAEWCNLMVLITATADRIGHEVYNLQRSEIGEVVESFMPGTVGSITMPHKRNPELSEHLGTLARVARHSAAMIAESLVHDHERDGRSWKVEWHALPQISVVTGKALALLRSLVANLEVNAQRMRANLDASRGLVQSEEIMLAFMPRVGRLTAHRLVYEAAAIARETNRPLKDVILECSAIMAHLDHAEVEALFDYRRSVRHCGTMIDRVLAQCGRTERFST
jgi:adenylosuccinate lyase